MNSRGHDQTSLPSSEGLRQGARSSTDGTDMSPLSDYPLTPALSADSGGEGIRMRRPA